MRVNIPICETDVYSITVNFNKWDLRYFGLWVVHIISV